MGVLCATTANEHQLLYSVMTMKSRARTFTRTNVFCISECLILYLYLLHLFVFHFRSFAFSLSFSIFFRWTTRMTLHSFRFLHIVRLRHEHKLLFFFISILTSIAGIYWCFCCLIHTERKRFRGAIKKRNENVNIMTIEDKNRLNIHLPKLLWKCIRLNGANALRAYIPNMMIGCRCVLIKNKNEDREKPRLRRVGGACWVGRSCPSQKKIEKKIRRARAESHFRIHTYLINVMMTFKIHTYLFN